MIYFRFVISQKYLTGDEIIIVTHSNIVGPAYNIWTKHCSGPGPPAPPAGVPDRLVGLRQPPPPRRRRPGLRLRGSAATPGLSCRSHVFLFLLQLLVCKFLGKVCDRGHLWTLCKLVLNFFWIDTEHVSICLASVVEWRPKWNIEVVRRCINSTIYPHSFCISLAKLFLCHFPSSPCSWWRWHMSCCCEQVLTWFLHSTKTNHFVTLCRL